MEALRLIGSWIWTGAAGANGAAGTGGLVGAWGWFTGLAAWQIAVPLALVVGAWAAYEGIKTVTYNPPVVSVGEDKKLPMRDLQKERKAALTSTDPAQKQRAIDAIEGRREVGAPDLPFRNDGYGIFVANNDVFVGQKSAIEEAPLSTVILWGTDGSRKVKDMAAVKNALQGNRTFPTPGAALQAYQTILKSTRRASATYVSHGKLGQFQDVPLRVGTEAVRIDTSVLTPDRWYAINNAERFLVR